MLYIASMLYVASLHNHTIVASGTYHIVFIKTENIVVDERSIYGLYIKSAPFFGDLIFSRDKKITADFIS